ncbi:MAG: ROK family protein [Verrucomicrobia bacterium]|nr:ROK family protein [Verrucomicrobiota bacterium]
MYLGVEIGGTKLQAGVCDRHGRVRQVARVAVERELGRDGILRQLERLVGQHRRVNAIGVGFGGPVDVERGRVLKSHHVAGWSGFELRRWCEKRFGLPVVVENDSNCATLAEARVGAGRGKRVVLYTNIGTGIGGGLAVDGELYTGRFGAMEIGHTRYCQPSRHDTTLKRSLQSCVMGATVESLASGLAIERGVSTVEEAARWYGAAIANAITLLNPDVVVVGGGVSLAGAKFWRPLRETVRRQVFPPFRNNFKLVPAALGETVVVVGAALLAMERRRP